MDLVLTYLAIRMGGAHSGRSHGLTGPALATRFLAAVTEHNGKPESFGAEATLTAGFPTAASALAALRSLVEANPGWSLRVALGLEPAAATGLSPLALPGEVLVQAAVMPPLRQALPEAVVPEVLPGQRLGEMASPAPVFRLSIPHLIAEVAPDQADGEPADLPHYDTHFIGRKGDVAAVQRLLEQHGVVVLLGPPGAGKTRLALQTARAASPQFSGNVRLVDLSRVADGDMAVQATAEQLGIREQAGRDFTALLTEHLSGRRALLVLDNCEQIARACIDLANHLLLACPELAVLATTQVPLQITGAVNYPVRGMSLPEPQALCDPAELMQSEAVRLFVNRALKADPQFALTPADTAAVADICRCLDGLPLAIELAAGRVKVLAVQQISARLADRLQLVTPDPLRTALDWYYDLLAPAHRALWRRMSVFAGPCSLAAIEAVCGDVPHESDEILGHSILDLVADLAERSVLGISLIGGEKYFRLLESIRQYGRERLELAGEAEQLHRRLRDHYDQLITQLTDSRGLFGPDQGQLRATLDATYENLRVALRWSFDAGESDTGIRMSAGLIRYWHGRGRLTEGRYWLGRMLQAENAATVWRARALWGDGTFAYQQGEMDVAEARLRESIAIAEHVGDKRDMARALNVLANLVGVKGDDDACNAAYARCLALYRELGDQRALGSVLHDAALLPKLQGDYDAARRLFSESLVIQRSTGNHAGAAMALTHLADIAAALGDPAGARSGYEESLVLAKASGDDRTLVRVLTVMGEMHAARGDADQAQACLEEARRLSADQGSQHSLARVLCGLAWVSRLSGNAAHAEERLNEAAAIITALHDSLLMAELLDGYAWLATAQGQWRQSVALFAAAYALRIAIRRPLPASRQQVVNERLAQLKSVLGPGVYRTVWAEGEQLQGLQALSAAQAPETASPVRRRGRPRMEGGPGGLTPREEEVVRLIAAGATSQEIARRLFLSRRTVETYEANIRIKLGIPNRAGLASWAATNLR